MLLDFDKYVNACTHCETDQGDDEPDDWYEEDEDCCHYCGKAYEDFSDLGCQYCDQRHPHYGVL